MSLVLIFPLPWAPFLLGFWKCYCSLQGPQNHLDSLFCWLYKVEEDFFFLVFFLAFDFLGLHWNLFSRPEEHSSYLF